MTGAPHPCICLYWNKALAETAIRGTKHFGDFLPIRHPLRQKSSGWGPSLVPLVIVSIIVERMDGEHSPMPHHFYPCWPQKLI
jgi:hypothetical protein